MKRAIVLSLALITITACTCLRETTRDNENKTEQITEEKTVAPSSFYQEKFIAGSDFFARGNEPFWILEINFNKEIAFTTPDDIKIKLPADENMITQDPNEIVYKSKNDSGEIIITLKKITCEDNMSGEKFDFNVNVQVKYSEEKEFRTYNGCGKFLYDFRLNDVWVMEEMTGVDLQKEKLLKGLPTFEFNLKEMKFSGHAGCNSLMGKIDVMGKKIFFGNIAATMMACPDMNVERAVIDALNKSKFTYHIESLKLILENKSGVKIIFKRVD